MAFSLNKIMLIGNLGKDSETRFTPNNNSVTSFTLATTNSYKGKDGNWVEETTWHNVVAWSLSDYMQNALKKGAKFYVEGRLTKRDYTDKDGIKRYATEVVSEKLIPLDSRGGGSEYVNQVPTSGQSKSISENYEDPLANQAATEVEDDLPF